MRFYLHISIKSINFAAGSCKGVLVKTNIETNKPPAYGIKQQTKHK